MDLGHYVHCDWHLSADNDEGGEASPKKVHFSEVDEIKLMSQDSLASLASLVLAAEAAGEGQQTVPRPQLCTTVMSTTALPSFPRFGGETRDDAPKINQRWP